LTLKLTSWSEFHNVVKLFDNNTDYVWRGERCYSENWKLRSSFDRRFPTTNERQAKLDEILTTFKHRLEDAPGTEVDFTDDQIWAIGQHYGLPTPGGRHAVGRFSRTVVLSPFQSAGIRVWRMARPRSARIFRSAGPAMEYIGPTSMRISESRDCCLANGRRRAPLHSSGGCNVVEKSSRKMLRDRSFKRPTERRYVEAWLALSSSSRRTPWRVRR